MGKTMSACTFFGHRDCPSNIRPRLFAETEQLITQRGVDIFYVGTQGAFDRIVYSVLKELRRKYSIRIYRVLAYMPKPGDADNADTILPEGIENISPRYAIVHRNNWMIDRCKYVIAYVTHISSGAYISFERAKLHGKTIILLTSHQNYGNGY